MFALSSSRSSSIENRRDGEGSSVSKEHNNLTYGRDVDRRLVWYGRRPGQPNWKLWHSS